MNVSNRTKNFNSTLSCRNTIMHRSMVLANTLPGGGERVKAPCRILFFSMFIALLSCSHSKQETSPAQSPNVLIILTDDLGYGDISCYNPKAYKTPNIDKLAEHGVSCTDFYVPTP
nr:sulfatase-like hydrolase/transferase [Sunxiuqinia sp.]